MERQQKGADGHNVVDFNIGCTITNAYNKQKYIFSLKKNLKCSVRLSAPF